tara:strand:+ start:53 stop:835 length:783 start_codon:yes stop_codon:yes gene_type:complete
MGEVPRTVSWFSCGAASAVATRMALDAHTEGKFVIGYCEIAEEHPDNKRFLAECQDWFNHPITIMGNDEYNRSIYEVFRRVRYLKGPKGAACTRLLKKDVREKFQRPDDIQVFGYTAEEQQRLDRFIDSNPDVNVAAPLIDNGVSKQDCLAIIARAGIELPEMYKLGYKNNNCVGCVKGEAGYWNKVREDFPVMFQRMSDMETHLGRTVCKREWKENGKRQLERIPLKELPVDLGRYSAEANIECGIVCEYVDADFKTHE